MVSMPRLRMPRKARAEIFRVVVAEVVEQQEGVELFGLAEAEAALELDARAFEGGGGLDDFFYGDEGTSEGPQARGRWVWLVGFR